MLTFAQKNPRTDRRARRAEARGHMILSHIEPMETKDILQAACLADARQVADLVEARFPKLNGKVEIYNIGTTIGSHTGPGTVALFFWGSERVN